MVKIDILIKFDKTKKYELFDFLTDPSGSYDANQLSLDLKSHNYITFDTEKLSYEATEDEATDFINKLLNDLLEHNFITEEALNECLSEENIWLSEHYVDSENVSQANFEQLSNNLLKQSNVQ